MGAKNNWQALILSESIWARYTSKYRAWLGRDLYQYGRYLGRKNPAARFHWPQISRMKSYKDAASTRKFQEG